MNMHSQYPVPFDEGELRDVLGRFATGVAVVTTCGVDAVPVGLTVNSFASVSLAPPEVLWSINSGAPSRSAFEQHGAFAVNVMPEDDQERVLQFARPNSDRFAGVPWRRGWRDVPILNNAIATLECDIKDMILCGDHHIVVGSVKSIDSREGNPLVFFRGQFTTVDQKD